MRRYEDVRGIMRRCWRREEVQESQGPRVQRSTGPKVQGSQGPRYLKLKFKYELDSKEGPSCFYLSVVKATIVNIDAYVMASVITIFASHANSPKVQGY